MHGKTYPPSIVIMTRFLGTLLSMVAIGFNSLSNYSSLYSSSYSIPNVL